MKVDDVAVLARILRTNPVSNGGGMLAYLGPEHIWNGGDIRTKNGPVMAWCGAVASVIDLQVVEARPRNPSRPYGPGILPSRLCKRCFKHAG